MSTDNDYPRIGTAAWQTEISLVNQLLNFDGSLRTVFEEWKQPYKGYTAKIFSEDIVGYDSIFQKRYWAAIYDKSGRTFDVVQFFDNPFDAEEAAKALIDKISAK